MARRSPFVITLSPTERSKLETIVRSTKAPAAMVRRAQVILRFAARTPLAQLARQLEMTRHDARKWIKRFIAASLHPHGATRFAGSWGQGVRAKRPS
jgi:hypothetical protein